jgi:hypothetical protein
MFYFKLIKPPFFSSVMPQTKIKYEKVQREITPKESYDSWACTAFLLNEM